MKSMQAQKLKLTQLINTKPTRNPMQDASNRGKKGRGVTIAQYKARQVEKINSFFTSFNQIQTENKMFERPNKIIIDQEYYQTHIAMAKKRTRKPKL